MEILLSAFILGIMGSFHCLGMCGPIAISIPLQGKHYGQKVLGSALYNSGRTITYGIMGAVFGLIGHGFQLMGFQRWISIIMGSLMVLAVFLPSLFKGFNLANSAFFTTHLRAAIGRLFTQRSYGGLFLIGLLNGLLPCGLVYMAIAGAIGTGDWLQGVLFMLLFGVGTIPMLMAINLAGNIISLGVRKKINKKGRKLKLCLKTK